MTTSSPTPAERFWSAHLDAVERDGLTVAEYARARSLSAASLYTWRSRLAQRRASAAREPSPRFAELVAAPAAAPTPPAPAPVALSLTLGPLRVELDALPDPSWLAALGAAVESSSR